MLRDLNSKCGEPQGVHMFKKILPKWNYDVDPKLALSLNAEFTKLKEQLEDPDNIEGKEFILELVTRGLLDNTAHAVATIYPSTEMQTSADRVRKRNNSKTKITHPTS
jgi:Zn-dependent M16 (insulinase) family peptidase